MTPEKKKYRNNYLSRVICQIKFAKNTSINDKSLDDYLKALGDEYSELANVKQQGIIIESSGSDLKTQTENTDLWEIQSSDKKHAITITQESLAITFIEYIKFRDYMVIVDKAVKLFLEKFEDIEGFQRIGLRYINQVTPDSLEEGWSHYINPKLTAMLDFVELDKTRRSMHTTVIQHDEDTKVSFNFGIFNEFFPAPIKKNEFILDLDAFIDSTTELDKFSEIIEKFNACIAIYFEQSITDELRNKMGVIEDGTD